MLQPTINIIPNNILDENFCIEVEVRDVIMINHFPDEIKSTVLCFGELQQYDDTIEDVPKEKMEV